MDEYDEALCRIGCGDEIHRACRAAGASTAEFVLRLAYDKDFAKAYRAAKQSGAEIREMRATAAKLAKRRQERGF